LSVAVTFRHVDFNMNALTCAWNAQHNGASLFGVSLYNVEMIYKKTDQNTKSTRWTQNINFDGL